MLTICNSLSSSFLFFTFKVLSSAMSFIFYSAIGMCASDFVGLIQQPLVAKEVISIKGSSSEETHRGASDSNSSSSKRLTILRRVVGGTSRLYKRAQHPASSLDEEPVPVTTILPSSVFRGVGKSGAGDVRASLRCGVVIMLGRHRHPCCCWP